MFDETKKEMGPSWILKTISISLSDYSFISNSKLCLFTMLKKARLHFLYYALEIQSFKNNPKEEKTSNMRGTLVFQRSNFIISPTLAIEMPEIF